ncbi:arginine kinase-like isoform X2 [Coccinella septempunctata]|uniref:arginine kinase-like isoform X2 n=1 Tax=Coccinella septempunctata TaxID=41139 RepID=UPI001D078EA0|nr:arginine kinase-like isoform X2 [Coccinella septempunctata]
MAFLRCQQCSLKCGTHYVPYDVLRLLRMGYRKLEYSKSQCLLKKFLTEELLEHLKFRRTSNDVNLYDCIKSGLENHDSKIGIYACDPECYFVFSPIFFPILEELHGFSPTDIHPRSEWTPITRVSNLEARRKFIKLTRIRVIRNLKGHPFCPQMSQKDFEDVEEYLAMILALMTGEYDGQYEKISEMTEDRKKQLKEKFILFDNTDKFLESAGAYRQWPSGRGVFTNSDENFIVQVNNCDHLKVISLEHGGNIRRTYERLLKAVLKLQGDMNFIKSARMGYVTLCPSDMGTALKVIMHLMLPHLSNHPKKLMECVAKLDVDIKTVPDNPRMFEISNRKRMGITEIESVLAVEHAAVSLISLEESS